MNVTWVFQNAFLVLGTPADKDLVIADAPGIVSSRVIL